MDKKKIVVLFSLGLILLVIIFIPGHLKIKRLNGQNRELERKIAEIKQTNKRLKEEQEKLLTDPVYLEEVARKKLGVVRKGEIVYKILPEEQNQ